MQIEDTIMHEAAWPSIIEFEIKCGKKQRKRRHVRWDYNLRVTGTIRSYTLGHWLREIHFHTIDREEDYKLGSVGDCILRVVENYILCSVWGSMLGIVGYYICIMGRVEDYILCGVED